MNRPALNFDATYQQMMLDRDFRFFLEKSMIGEQYSEHELETLRKSYVRTKNELSEEHRRAGAQMRHYLFGQVMLMFHGGLLPSLFRIDGWTRGSRILDFEAYGKDWATFEMWQKLEKRHRFWAVSWERITRLGAVLAILLSALKLMEAFGSV